ncbi:regulatory protein RecX [Persephonella sp.]
MNKEVLRLALKLLSKRDYFSAELKNKLIKKGYSPDEIDTVLSYLKDKGYINDEKLSEYLYQKLKEKGKSSLYIKKKFFSKGVQPPEFSYEDELETAYRLLKEKFKKEKKFDTVVKFLKNRGFSFSVSIDAANKFLEEE